MAKNQLCGFGFTSNGGATATATNLSSGGKYIPRSVNELYLSSDLSLLGSSRYLASPDQLLSSSSSSMLFGRTVPGAVASPTTSQLASQVSWSGPPGVDVGVGPTPASADPPHPGLKRPVSEALYHRNVMGAYNTIGQTEAWFSANPLAKRPRLESASSMPIYPQRPGEKDCAHYMLTRTCKFGDSCKFDHPIWVPEGGIPDWKEVPLIIGSECLPERPGEPDCPYFLKTQRCKFGSRCRFNHPKDKMLPLGQQGSLENIDVAILPERPSEPSCAFYLKTGKCKYGATCKFHHPKDLQITLAGFENHGSEEPSLANNDTGSDLKPVKQFSSPALMHNTKGLPIRLGEVDCPFYLKTGSCKYGPTCRYNHPDRNAINPPAAIIGSAFEISPAKHLNIGVLNPASSMLQNFESRLTQTTLHLGLSMAMFPQRPGEIECDFYMKTGDCKFGHRCKFHHPVDRSAPTASAKEAEMQNVRLTLAGFPRREGAIHCPYYMRTGTCKYGATCKFDHPPPGEVMALAIGPNREMGENQNGG